MADRPNLTLSDLINEALDLARLERVSIQKPFDVYELTGSRAGERGHLRPFALFAAIL